MFKVVDIDDLKAVLKAGVEALVCVTFLIVYKDHCLLYIYIYIYTYVISYTHILVFTHL
jgi:hypothetical protein